jgi:hypothetical protein
LKLRPQPLKQGYPVARSVLAGRVDGLPTPISVVVVEGEPDFLTWATRYSDGDADAPIVFGVVCGAWSGELAARIPDGARVVVRTHQDPSGERYAAEIARTLLGRCRVVRPRAREQKAA